MNREQIIQMARGSGIEWVYLSEDAALSMLVPIERLFRAAYAAGAAAEREACAQIVDANAKQCGTVIRLILESNAAAIRARGQV